MQKKSYKGGKTVALPSVNEWIVVEYETKKNKATPGRPMRFSVIGFLHMTAIPVADDRVLNI